MLRAVVLALLLSPGAIQVAHAVEQQTLVIDHVRVHGNHSTPDDEVLRIAALPVGERADATVLEQARQRLVASGRFASVELRQRARSIDDPSPVAVIVLVAEHPSVRPIDVGIPEVPGPLGRLRRQMMFLPIVGVQDGYGLTYGLRTALVGGRHSNTRVSVPASWGGTRQLAAEVERTFAPGTPDATSIDSREVSTRPTSRGLLRVKGSAGLWRQEHPYFERGQFRQYAEGEVSWRPRPFVGLGATLGTAAVHFGDVDDRMTTGGVHAEVDTRRDPLFPRNAVYARSSVRRATFAHPERSGLAAGARTLWRHDLRGYVGVVGQVVVATRIQVEKASAPLPAYAQPILGGADTLRGIRAGLDVGDNLWAGTLELRAPLTSVLRRTRLGVLAFHDTGVVWDHGERWQDRDRERGFGAGVFLINPFVQLQLSVARAIDRGTRVHVSTGVSF